MTNWFDSRFHPDNLAQCHECGAITTLGFVTDHEAWHTELRRLSSPSISTTQIRRPLFARRMEIREAIAYFDKYGFNAARRNKYIDVLIRAVSDFVLAGADEGDAGIRPPKCWHDEGNLHVMPDLGLAPGSDAPSAAPYLPSNTREPN